MLLFNVMVIIKLNKNNNKKINIKKFVYANNIEN